jgi:Mce-associated membrane protein
LSPRRKIQPGEAPLFVTQAAVPRRLCRLALTFAVAGLVIAEALTACVLILVSHESHRRAVIRDAAVLTYVRSFMTGFTSPDPFHANDYVERVLDQATGEFAKQFRDRANEALLRVARAEPTTGTILDVGVERWNDDGSANVLVATEIASRQRDGKNVVEGAYRWVVTAKPEGDQWRISSLIQVI